MVERTHAPVRVTRPFVVAHGSGNSLARLNWARRLGVTAVEADIRLYRGRLEVRHMKTVGPVPLLWDRWKIASPFARRLLADELLAAVPRGTHLLLDLKGRNPRLSTLLVEVLEPHARASGFEITLCARTWALLEPFADVPGVRLVASVGSARQLRCLSARRVPKLDGISIHERLLDVRTARELTGMAGVIFTWPVNTVERAQELIACGVEGLISDRPELVHPVTAADG